MRCANGIKTSCNLVSGRANGLIRCPQTANLRNMKRAETDQEDIQSLARAHAADAIAVLAEIMNNPDASAGARLSAAKALLDRGWGKAGAKPPEDGNRAAPVSQIRRVIVDPRQGDERRKFGDRSTIPASERTERDCEKHAWHVFRPRLCLGSLVSLAPKIACRQFCRTRVRNTDPYPP